MLCAKILKVSLDINQRFPKAGLIIARANGLIIRVSHKPRINLTRMTFFELPSNCPTCSFNFYGHWMVSLGIHDQSERETPSEPLLGVRGAQFFPSFWWILAQNLSVFFQHSKTNQNSFQTSHTMSVAPFPPHTSMHSKAFGPKSQR